MTPDQLDRIISSLSALHAEADAVIDTYVRHIRQRDDLGAIPPDCIRQTQIEGRAGVCMDARHALQLIRADIAGAKAAPTAVSVPHAFDPATTGVSDNISPLAAARQLKQARKAHE
jgi:hypothetical protein